MEDLGDLGELSDSSYFSDNEDDEEEHTNDRIHKTTDQDKPIYENASLTISGSMMSIITFVMRHKLAGAALCDLLELIELHCPSPNNCKTTMRGLRKYFVQARQRAEFHKYCNNCSSYIGISEMQLCHICSNPISNDTCFIMLPFAEQLQEILSRKLALKVLVSVKQLTQNIRYLIAIDFL